MLAIRAGATGRRYTPTLKQVPVSEPIFRSLSWVGAKGERLLTTPTLARMNICECGDIDHPEGARALANPDLTNARAN